MSNSSRPTFTARTRAGPTSGRAPGSTLGASSGLTLAAIRPFDVATYIEGLQQEHSAPGVKQQLAAVRMLRLADYRSGAADQSGRRRARAETCAEDRQDAGAGRHRVAQIAQVNSGHDVTRSARSSVDRHSHGVRFSAVLEARVDSPLEGAGFEPTYAKNGKSWVCEKLAIFLTDLKIPKKCEIEAISSWI
jgi:hypothetical protein